MMKAAILLALACPLGAGAQAFSCAQPLDAYSETHAGLDLATAPKISGGSCTGPFFFSVPLPEGEYTVTVELGGPAASVTTVKVEARRLMLLNEPVAAGGRHSFTFNVTLRTPQVSATESVRLKPREIGALNWDRKLTLEFSGSAPAVRSIRVKPTAVPTLYLAGDSTVVDQQNEPWAAWGQMLPLFVSDRAAVSNQAESGETIRSFVSEHRWAKVLTTLHKGDFLFVQFAHNDQKAGSGFVSIPDYKKLLREFIATTRERSATLILVTSMNRRAFDESGHIQQTLGEYPAAMREVAAEDHVALIDLNAISKTIFEALGPEGSLKAFVHFPAGSFPDQPQALADDTHFTSYGAYLLTRAVVADIERQHLPVARFLRKDIPAFDTSHPEPFDHFTLPPSPFFQAEKPYER